MVQPAVDSERRKRTADSLQVKRLGWAAGFDLIRIAPVTELRLEQARFLRWRQEGRQASMRWITPDWIRRSTDPMNVLAHARSVVCVGLSYWGGHRPASSARAGKIARYAWGRDYHEVLGERLRKLADTLMREFGGEHRWYVDTGPLMDKALAARSGLGWYGKNTNILTERFGSFVLLGEIVTTLELEPDAPLQRDCGACRLCVVACPTGALGPDYSIDSRKCISYLTIEHRSAIPKDLRPLMGSWVFGCDICQDVCPPTMRPHLESDEERRLWTAEVRGYTSGRQQSPKADLLSAKQERSGGSSPLFSEGTRSWADLVWLLQLSHAQYLEAFRGTAIRRAKAWMLRRNAAVALGNVGENWAVAPLATALGTDEHPIVRGHAAWALGQIATRHAQDGLREALVAALQSESDAEVRREIEEALALRKPSTL